MSGNIEITIPEEVIMSKIYLVRDKKVMLDSDLSDLYEVETKQLKRAVRRNIKRFPGDFMFELTDAEFTNLRSQFGTSNWGGVRYCCSVLLIHGVTRSHPHEYQQTLKSMLAKKYECIIKRHGNS